MAHCCFNCQWALPSIAPHMGNYTIVERSSLNEQNKKVGKLVEKHYDSSLKFAGIKGKEKLEGLSKKEKREWREALQRAISNIKNRKIARIMATGHKPRGKTRSWVRANSTKESNFLWWNSQEPYDVVELQSGLTSAVVSSAAVVGAALAGKTMVDLSGAANRAGQAADVASSAVNEIKQAVTSTSSRVIPVIDRVNMGADLFGTILTKFNEFIEQLKSAGGWISKFVVAVVAYWLVSTLSDSTFFVGSIVALVSAFAPEIVSFVKGATGVEQQSGVGNIAAMVALLGTLIVPGNGRMPTAMSHFLRNVGHFPKVCEGLEVFVDKSLKLAESALNFVLRRESTNWITLGRKRSLVDAWRCECIRICAEFHSTPKPSRELVHLASKKVQEGYGFLQLFVTNDMKREVGMWVDKLNVCLNPHLATLTAEHNVRPMPYMMMLGGGSGKGKTSVVQAVASFILLLSGEVKAGDVLPNLWQKGLSEYWNGYLGQRAIIKDDCFQVRGMPGQHDSEAMEIIRAIGNWACPLNFADVESKGRYYLDVALMVGTTNAKNIRADWEPFITCPEALTRRFQGAYWIDISKDWDAERKFDFYRVQTEYQHNLARFTQRKKDNPGWKPSKEEVLDIFPWNVWEVRMHTYDNSNPENGPVFQGGLKRAVLDAADEIVRRREMHVKTVQHLNDHLIIMEDVLNDITFDEVQTQAGSIYANIDTFVSAAQSMSATCSNPMLGSVRRYVDSMPEAPFSVISDISSFEITLDREEDLMPLREFREREESVVDMTGAPILEVCSDPSVCGGELTRYRHRGWPRREKTDSEQREEIRLLNERLHTFINYDDYTREDAEEEQWYAKAYEFMKMTVCRLCHFVGITDCTAKHLISEFTVVYLSCIIIKAAVTGLWAVCKGFLKLIGVKPRVGAQSNDVAPKENKGLKKFDFPKVTLQLGTPPSEGVHDAIFRNMYTIEVVHSDKTRSIFLGTCLGVGDSVYLMPRHFLKRIEECLAGGDTSWRVVVTLGYQRTHRVSFTLTQFLGFRTAIMDGFDLIGVDFGRIAGLRANRNIVKYFLESSELSNLMRGSNTAVRLDVLRPGNDGVAVRNIMHSSSLEYSGTVVAHDGYSMRGCVKYQMPTLAGDCGGPLTLQENRYFGGRALLGLHVAGRSSFFSREGYATLMPQETVREIWLMLSSVRDSSAESMDDLLVSQHGEEAIRVQNGLLEAGLVGGSITYLGEVKTPLMVAVKTAYKPSPMQEDGIFGPTPTRPAVLQPIMAEGKIVYPMARAVEAYQSPVLVGDSDQLRVAADMAFKKHMEVTKRFPRDVLSFEEAIVPPEGWKLKPLNRRSSAGYKYRDVIPNLARYPGKTYFLGHEGDVDFSNPNLGKVRDDVNVILTKARRGERDLHIFTDFLKDELRSLEKVDQVRTRMISGAELDYTLAVRMYFGAFQAAMLATCVSNGMSPGINHYTEWGSLAEGLLSKGGAVFDGDFSRFDASEQPWVHEAILSYINRWYAQGSDWKLEDDVVRTVLWQDLIHSRHLTGTSSQLRYLVQWHKSLPSGHPLTTTVNSMYSLLTLSACYMKLTGDANDMWEHAFLNTFGDDNVAGVDDQVREQFNQVTVGPVMSELFGLTYTPGVKDGIPVKYTDIGGVVYLQRSFLPDNDKETLLTNCPNVGWVAPLNFKSFMYTPYWYKNSKDCRMDLERNCEILVCELALHPISVWDEKFPKLEKWCSDNEIPLRFINRDAARAHIKTRLDVWF
ncbi:hypothetical protein 1 [Wenzhou picorna-like virus 31]|uniref:hypothetical protein 1 n=1 Tax=Wenzhou picorna-like virus 31 TaxID=1923617 RepID=UPI00090B306C|nr:hypothetical protein 1 [Wenzhou picorna-like virus 31]APG78523.1 hypothetical protein 1 [Wenzhou picorna-like virus 31]